MKPYNKRDEVLTVIQYTAKALSVIGFVWCAGLAFQASLHAEGCISLFMAWFAPVLLGDEL